MYRLIRKNHITASTDISGSSVNNKNKTVSLDKLRELLSQVKQLRHNDIYIDTTDSGEIILIVDNIRYETE